MPASRLNTFADGETNSLAALARQVESEFRSRHAQSPTWIVAAPGRVNLIGEHIDYSDGFVLPMAIDRYVAIAAATTGDSSDSPTIDLYSSSLDQVARVPLDRPLQPRDSGWARYLEGVLAGFAHRGHQLPAFSALIESNVPVGSGLSSSAAIEVATATLLEAILGDTLELKEKALLCQRAEHEFAGVPCGIMDQFSSVFGQKDALMLLDCRSQEIESVPFTAADVAVLITNSNVKHELTGGEYAERRAQCEAALDHLGHSTWRDVTLSEIELAQDQLDAIEYRRARHVVTEIDRTVRAADAIRDQQWDAAGDLMYASHSSLRDDYEVSCDELDLLVDLARKMGAAGGVIGSRMTGGGFGGCTVSLIKADRAQDVAAQLRSSYHEETGIQPFIFVSRPARGAHVLHS